MKTTAGYGIREAKREVARLRRHKKTCEDIVSYCKEALRVALSELTDCALCLKKAEEYRLALWYEKRGWKKPSASGEAEEGKE